MKEANGDTYMTIGEVSKEIDRTVKTIKNWYEWFFEQPHDVQVSGVLPTVHTWLDLKGTRYFRQDDVKTLVRFRDSIKPGKMATTSRKKWGRRGKKDA